MSPDGGDGTLDRPGTESTPGGEMPLTWRPFGYLRLEYSAVRADPNVAFVGRADGFSLQNARIGTDVSISTVASFRFSIDAAIDERARVNDPNGTLGVGLRDAYLDQHLGGLDARLGHFEVVFDPEEVRDATERPFVDDSLESRGVPPNEGFQTPGLSPGRSLGIAVRRDPGVPEHGVALGFELAVQNGAPDLASVNDNDLPAISAAGLLRFAGDGWVTVAGRLNPRSTGDLPLRQDETDLQAAVGAELPLGPVRVGVGGIAQRTSFESTGGPAQNAWGGHGQLVARVWGDAARTIHAGYRFSIFDPSDLVLSDRMMEHTLGVVLAAPRAHSRVQINATHAAEQSARTLTNDRLEVVFEVSL